MWSPTCLCAWHVVLIPHCTTVWTVTVHGRDDIYSGMTGGGRGGGRCQDLQRVRILSLSLYLPCSTFLWIRKMSGDPDSSQASKWLQSRLSILSTGHNHCFAPSGAFLSNIHSFTPIASWNHTDQGIRISLVEVKGWFRNVGKLFVMGAI